MTQRLKYVLAHRTDGLGGKILNLMAAMRLAKKYGLQVLVCWDPQDEVHDSWLRRQQAKRLLPKLTYLTTNFLEHSGHDVFVVPAHGTLFFEKKYKHLIEADGPRKFDVGEQQNFLPLHVLENYDLVATSCYPLRVEGEEQPDLLQQKGDAYRVWRQEFEDCWNSLTLHKGVEKTVARFATAKRLDQAVAVHIRRGDVQWAHENRETVKWDASKRFIPVEEYFRVIDEHFPGKTFFISSDSPDVRKEFEQKYPGRVIHYAVRSYTRENPVTCDGLYEKILEEELARGVGKDAMDLVRIALEDSLIETLLLSKCQHLISGPSQFAYVARYLGGMPHTLLHNH